MSSASAIFASHARSSSFSFKCAQDVKVGAFQLRKGESLKVTVDGRGKYYLSVEWAEGSIGPVPAATVNLLAGEKIVEDEVNFHWAGTK
jgi:hypothetical protein